jgi:hypothetical protein
VTGAGVLDLWEAGLSMTPAARAVMLLEAGGFASPDSLPVGSRDEALLRSYCRTPEALAAVTECAACGTSIDLELDLTQLTGLASSTDEIVVDHAGHHVVARLPTAGDLRALDPARPLEELRRALAASCVVEATYAGRVVAADQLPEDVAAAVEEALELADPGSDLRLDVSCPECEATWVEELDPVRFAWSAVETSARRLATDIHTLAHAYGWSEEQILQLSPFRRHLYLSAVRP